MSMLSHSLLSNERGITMNDNQSKFDAVKFNQATFNTQSVDTKNFRVGCKSFSAQQAPGWF